MSKYTENSVSVQDRESNLINRQLQVLHLLILSTLEPLIIVQAILIVQGGTLQ